MFENLIIGFLELDGEALVCCHVCVFDIKF